MNPAELWKKRKIQIKKRTDGMFVLPGKLLIGLCHAEN
jgi:hypothetical protein